ncbi:MAG TPA: tRNA lysidine(34) synthetase TilS [Tepidisphaeraceae bacterium]
MDPEPLQLAIQTVPAGAWAVAVSGGADSVALLRLLHGRGDLSLRVVHLDHQTRGEASAGDAAFVSRLAGELGVPCTVALRADVERQLGAVSPNPSARYRAARIELFRRVVAERKLDGVILAHHAGDQAETVLQRLIRGSGPAGLVGMSGRMQMGDLVMLRPLLGVRRGLLREYLQAIGQGWREDASNASDDYLRNRLRKWLAEEPGVHEALIALCEACRGVSEWAKGAAPRLEEAFPVGRLAGLPDVLAHEAARQWLEARGAPPEELSEGVLERLVMMARDAASPPRAHFPGSVLVRRRSGVLSAG